MNFHLMTLVHLLASTIWVGGMFFAHMFLRPAALESLEPPQRLSLWNGVFARFFPWVWGCVITLVLTGQVLVVQLGGMAAIPVQLHIMTAVGYLMGAIFAYLFFAPYPALKRAVAAADWPAAAAALNRMRVLVAVNLSLGLGNIALLFVFPLFAGHA